jgi:hypothetical protein
MFFIELAKNDMRQCVTSGQISCQIGTLASGVGATMSYVVTLAASGSRCRAREARYGDFFADHRQNRSQVAATAAYAQAAEAYVAETFIAKLQDLPGKWLVQLLTGGM